MELIENLLQLLTTFLGALLSGIAWQKSRRQAYFLLLCFYGCFALGSLYWTLYLLLFNTTPRVFYVSEFGWVASVIFLRILQVTLTDSGERGFRCRKAWLAPLVGVPLLVFYCTYGDVLSNLIWCGLMIWLSFCAVRGLFYANTLTIEIHHDEQNPNGPFKEMTRTDHRLGVNYKKNHPNHTQKSKIDRTQWKYQQRKYWENEWDSGRWNIK